MPGGAGELPRQAPKPKTKRTAPAWIGASDSDRQFERRDIVPRPEDDRREDENDDADDDEPARRLARGLPLVETDPPEAAEGDDEGHVDGPAREVVLAHLGRAHAVEEELEVPGRPGQGGPDVVRQERRRPRRGLDRPDPQIVPAGLVPQAQGRAPDEVSREAAE